MSCLFSLPLVEQAIGNTEFYKDLISKFGDIPSLLTCLTRITKIDINENNIPISDFSEPFKDAYKKQFGTEIPDINTRDIVELSNLIDAALIYNDGQKIDGNNSILLNDAMKLSEDYTHGNTTRLQGIKIAQGMLFDAYFNFRYKYPTDTLIRMYGINNPKRATKEMYQSETVSYFVDSLIKRINATAPEGKSITNDIIKTNINKQQRKEYKDYYVEQGIDQFSAISLASAHAKFDYILSLLNKNNLSPQTNNIIAAINEMLNFDTVDINGEQVRIRDDYFNRVWNSTILSQLYVRDNIDRGDDFTELDEDEFFNASLSMDLSFRDYEDRLGRDYSTYKLHISPEINLYLKHLNDVESAEVNDFGLSTKMDSSRVSALLYNAIDNTSLDDMINSIQNLASNIPGFKGLQTLYEDLMANRDLAAKFYVSFAKYKMPSLQVMLNGEKIAVTTNESAINRKPALRYQYYNDVRRKCINLKFNDKEQQTKLDKVNSVYKEFNSNNTKENREKAVILLTDLFKEYLPSIDYANISNYISKSGSSETEAFKQLYNVLKRLIPAATQLSENVHKNRSSIIDTDPITNNVTSVLNDLAELLLPYSNPFTELTVSNVLGKNHSALQNNSFLTRFISQLKTDLNNNEKGEDTPLLEYANYLFQSNQYKFSNILLEHRDENGNIINQGLFRYNGEKLEYTPYAKQLLDIVDFDGISNAFGDAVTYVKTSKADYTISEYEVFFKERKVKDRTITLAPYLLKTPSDASHNYALYAPLYKVDSKNSLFNYDVDLVDNRVNTLFNKIRFFEGKSKVISNRKLVMNYDNFMTNLFDGKFKVFANSKNAIKTAGNDYLNLTINDGNISVDVIVEGKYDVSTNTFTRNQNNYLTVLNDTDKSVKDIVRNQIKNDIINKRHIHIDDQGNWLEKSINKNHVIFKQLRQAFTQEMQNAAEALKVMTNRQDGLVTSDDFKKDTSKLYKNYHFDGKTVIKNGKLTGKVFSSDRFTLTDKNGNQVNYMTKVFEVDGKKYQVIDDSANESNPYSINFLYGGAYNSNLHINADGNIEFTAEQQEAIDYAISQFINDYIEDTKTKLLNYNDSVHETSFTSDDNIAEFALNYQLFYINSCDLFDGDSKFYKSSQDMFKRLKEVQAGGLSYALFDMSKKRINDTEEKTLNENSYLNSERVQNLLRQYQEGIPEKYKLHDCLQYNSFRATTIENRVVVNGNEIPIIEKHLADCIYKSGDFTREQAKERAAELMKGYKEITTDDAQSYITIEEFIRRLAAKGQLEENLPLIQKILNPNAKISDKDLETFVQIQKNFYYDLHYDANTNVVAPRQIKNAEFVLIPRFIEGTQLESLYDAMISGGIDQLNTEETSKAGKTQAVKVWTKGDTIKKQTKALGAEFRAASQQFDYNYLYTQQENPQHMNDENKAGVQIVKKIIDNIIEVDVNDETIDKNLRELCNLKHKFLDLFSENIKDSFNNLMTDLIDDVANNIKDGHLVIEGEKVQGIKYVELLNRLKYELLRVNADSNSLDYVTLIDNAFETVSKQGNFVGLVTKMPTIFPAIKSRLESAAQAIFTNAITRQTLPGFHAAQVTSVGFAKIKSNQRLNYHISNDKFSSYVEVMVPASAFGLSLDGTTPDNLLKQIQAAGLDEFIGYRIPTEGKQSIALMKVVGILDNTQGSSIVVPDGWVAQTGSDFDVDSIYTIMHETFIDKNTNKIYKYKNENGDRRNRNNEICDTLISILKNPLTVEEGLSQSKTTHITSAMDDLFKGSYLKRERESRSSFNVLDQAEYQSEGLQGKDLKAISVNRDGFNSICNVAKPILNKPITVVYEGDDAKYKLAIKTFGKQNVIKLNNNHFKVVHSTWGWTNNNRNIEGELLTVYSSETTAHMLDAVKIGHIPNVNKETFKVYKTLVDVGSNYHTALAFIIQPIISRFIDKLERKNSIYSQDLTDPIKQTYADIARSLGLNTSGTKEDIKDIIKEALSSELNQVTDNILDYEILKRRFDTNTLVEESDNIEKAIDFKVLEQYEYIDEIASEAENYANVLRSDKFGAKQTLYRTKKVFRDIQNILFKSNRNFSELDAIMYNIDELQKVLSTEEGNKIKVTLADSVLYSASTKEDWINIRDEINPSFDERLEEHIFTREEAENYLEDFKEQLKSKEYQLIDRKKDLFTVGYKNLLVGIYPGIEEGFESYIQQNRDDESVYKPLQYFLKYGTGSALAINKLLFPTEQEDFDDLVNGLADTLGLKELSEDLYNSYSNYILQHIYSLVNTISMPMVYNPSNGFHVQEVDTDEEREKLREAELQRIYGYEHIKREGYNPTNFIPKDINNPTEEEIKIFASFSPAEKVQWLRDKAGNALVAKYLIPRTYISKQYKEKYQACQTLRFNEDNFGIENIFDEFEKTFNNKNPFFALTALDIIKYAFIVEGYQSRRHSINRIIKNSVLTNDTNNYDLDLIEDLKKAFGNFIANIDNTVSDNLIEKFLRSHTDIKELPKVKLNKDKKKTYLYGKRLNDTDVLRIENTKENEDFLKDIKEYTVFQYYVKEQPVTELYKRIESNDYTYLYPLSKLQNNESGDVSWNKDNNKYKEPFEYEEIIKENRKRVASYKILIEPQSLNDIFNKAKSYYNKNRNTETLNSALENTIHNLDIYKTASDKAKSVIEKVVKFSILSHIDENGNLDLTNYTPSTQAFIDAKEESDNKIRQSTREEVLVFASKQNLRVSKTSNSELYKKFEKQLNTSGVNIHENDLNASDDVKAKKTVEAHLEDVAAFNSMLVKNQVADIENRLTNFTKIGDDWISINDARVYDLIKKNPELHAEFLTLLLDAQRLIDTYTNETYDFRKITGDNNNSFVRESIAQINSDIAKLSTLPALAEAEQNYVEMYLAKLSNNPNIREAITNLYDSYHATSLFAANINDFQDTHNPMLQVIETTVMQKIRGAELQSEDVIESFRKDWKDITDRAKAAGRPININNIIDDSGRLIQEYNKQFESDLKQFDDDLNELDAKYKDIAAEYDKNSTEENKLARYNAYKVYIQKELEYYKWKLRNINQEVKDEYENRRVELIEDIFNKYPDIYIEYRILKDKQYELYKVVDFDHEDDNFKKLEEVDRAINALTSLHYKDPKTGEWKEKTIYDGSGNNTYEIHEGRVNDSQAAYALREFEEKTRLLNSKIYTREEREDFQENVKKHLQTIHEAEAPKFDAEGKSYIPSQKVLFQTNEEYRKAKIWLYRNATYFYGSLLGKEGQQGHTPEEYVAELNKLYKNGLDMDYAEQLAANPNMTEEEKEKLQEEYNFRIEAALRVFRTYDAKGHDITTPRLYKTIAKNIKAYDEFGVIDGTKFSAEDVADIKKNELNRLGRKESAILSEKTIIHYVPDVQENVIYTRAFYAGMTTEGMQNQDYEPIVRELNSYLIHGVNQNGQFDASLLSIDDLREIRRILEEHFGFDPKEKEFAYENTVNKKKNVPKSSRKAVAKFIKENVDFVWNQKAFDDAAAKIENESEEFKKLWYSIFEEYNEDKAQYVPNHLFFGYAKPKESTGDEYIDKQKTIALRILDKAFERAYTRYYYDAREEALARDKVEPGYYNKWYDANHVYNPNKHRFEPLPIWTSSTPVYNNMPGEWKPTFNQQIKTVSEEARNADYKQGLSRQANFKANTADNKYINSQKELTNEEKELKDLIFSTIMAQAKNKKSARRIQEGWLPAKAKANSKSITDPTLWLGELMKGLGFITGYQGTEDWQKHVEYGTDYVPDMPMLHMLKSVDSTKDSEIKKNHERLENETEEEYNKRIKEYDAKEKEKALQIHKDLIDKNWEQVISEFIKQASHYNAVQENKLMLYFGQKLLNDYGTYEQERKQKGFGTYTARRNGGYQKVKDVNLQEQYANWIRRVVFDQFKKPQGWRTRAFQMMQSLTSTQYMTLNIRAGVSNVTVGMTNIIAEAFAREYFDEKTYAKGKALYGTGIADYMLNMWKETSKTKVGAIIKGMNVIDFTELTGQVRELTAEEASKRLRDLAFGPLSAGEHYMQNSGMISMMLSHRVVKTIYGDYAIMNEREYYEQSAIDVFNEMATDEEKAEFETKKEEIRNNPELAKDYQQFRKNLVTEFVVKFDKERQKEFAKRKEEYIKAKQGTFKENPTVWDQLDLGENGKMKFADGSILKAINDKYKEDKKNGNTKATLSPAYELLGRFKGRVIDVNKKIHGWYDKYSAAKIESGLLGGLIMQYHKHIVPGLLKRYRVDGYFNESRGTVEKGYYVSLVDFLKLNFDNIKDRHLSDDQKGLLKGTQNLFGYIWDYLTYITTTYNILPEYEKSNIRRNIGDIAGQLTAISLGLLVLLGFDDDDDDAFLPNFILYQADRLSSEAWMWNPIGVYPEFKKLYSNPIAFSSNISDIMESMEVIAGLLFGGEDYNPKFTTGRYAGRHKLGVYVERRIPYWRNIRSIMDISINNKYYKLGGNPVSWTLPKLKEWNIK